MSKWKWIVCSNCNKMDYPYLTKSYLKEYFEIHVTDALSLFRAGSSLAQALLVIGHKCCKIVESHLRRTYSCLTT